MEHRQESPEIKESLVRIAILNRIAKIVKLIDTAEYERALLLNKEIDPLIKRAAAYRDQVNKDKSQ